jgi:hypothetical protein
VETTNIFQKIAMSTGLPSLAVEVGFLLVAMFLILIVILVVLVLLRVSNEMVRMRKTANYIAGLLTRGAADRKISTGYYDFKPDEWKEGTRRLVVEMLQQGKPYNEILKKVDVSKAYIGEVELWAKMEGLIQIKR